MNSTPLSCPVCRSPLFKKENTYKCEKNHSFDIAKSGYTNLYLNFSAKDVGDNAVLSNARAEFLSKGYYGHLLLELTRIFTEHAKDINDYRFVDAGCASGYYTGGIFNALKNVTSASAFGFDLSLYSLKRAAKSEKEISFFLSNIFSLPLFDSSVDAVLSCFCPISESEFSRILKKDGLLAVVSPASDHLFELKRAVYETPYENEEKTPLIPGFSLIKTEKTTSLVTLKENEDVLNLFKMTPYFYNTSETDKNKLLSVEALKTTASFIINIYRKN